MSFSRQHLETHSITRYIFQAVHCLSFICNFNSLKFYALGLKVDECERVSERISYSQVTNIVAYHFQKFAYLPIDRSYISESLI